MGGNRAKSRASETLPNPDFRISRFLVPNSAVAWFSDSVVLVSDAGLVFDFPVSGFRLCSDCRLFWFSIQPFWFPICPSSLVFLLRFYYGREAGDIPKRSYSERVRL